MADRRICKYVGSNCKLPFCQKLYDNPIEGEVKKQLCECIECCNRESGLHMQLCLEEPEVFSGFLARYGKFTGVKNYIALIGEKEPGLEEKCGYYGERTVLRVQQGEWKWGN